MRSIWSFLSQLPLGVCDEALTVHNSGLCGSSFTSSSSVSISSAWNCPVDTPVSCHNNTAFPDSCCFNYPSGQFVSSQFWDTDPAVGPADSWTIHGLWPNYCNGSYPSYCTAAPTYGNLSDIISTLSPSLFDYMNSYWLPSRGSNDHFWAHEWNKHGTCVNTLAPSCYADDQFKPGKEVVDYFQRTVDLFKQLDTYKALASADILPSYHKTYSLEEMQAALKNITGQEVILGCYRGHLNQVWYYFNVKGSLQDGNFVAFSPDFHASRGSCPRAGIKYLPKHMRSFEEEHMDYEL